MLEPRLSDCHPDQQWECGGCHCATGAQGALKTLGAPLSLWPVREWTFELGARKTKTSPSEASVYVGLMRGACTS